jgi:hypothetical protein
MVLSAFDTQFYNGLPSIEDADTAFVDRNNIFTKLAPLFAREEYRGVYDVCLIHHHFDLKPGERMVSHGSISLPTLSSQESQDDPLIIPERWTAYGDPFEFRKVKSGEEFAPPPPASLLEEFRQCVGDQASILGICLAEGRLPEGHVYWETTNDHVARSHVLEIKERVDLADCRSLFETCWRPESDGTRIVMTCCAVCDDWSHCNP